MRLILFGFIACIGLRLLNTPRAWPAEVTPGIIEADDQSKNLLAAIRKTMEQSQTLEGDVTGSQLVILPDKSKRGWVWQASLRLMKPNLALVHFAGNPMLDTVASDGTSVFVLHPGGKRFDNISRKIVDISATYTKENVDTRGANVQADIPQVALFFTGEISILKLAEGKVLATYKGKQTVNDSECEVIEFSYALGHSTAIKGLVRDEADTHRQTTEVYSNAEHMVLRVRTVMADPMGERELLWDFKQLKSNRSLEAKDFAYQFPKDAVLFHPPTEDQLKQETDRNEQSLLAIGKAAPLFTLKTPDGGEITLSELLKGRKAVLINFWFNGCGPCQAEFPTLQKIYAEHAEKGLGMLAINNGDSAELIKKWADARHYTFATAMAGEGRLSIDFKVVRDYGVPAYPTTYLVGADGKILWRCLGPVKEQELLTALDTVGVK